MERCFVLCRDLGLQAFSLDECSYFPRTWLLPDQKTELEAHIQKQRLAAIARGSPIPTYIVKPSGGSEGIGIFLLQHERLIPRYKVATIPLVVQDYIAPMLLDGKKFDFRLYVLIRSVDPLEVYLHCEGLARFCTENYEPPSEENLGRSFAHLTNYSLNKASERFVHLSESEVAASAAGENDFLYAGCSKRPLTEVMRDLEERGLVRERMLWMRIEKLVALTALAIQPELALRYRARFPRAWPSDTIADAAAASSTRRHDLSHNAFHILGVDVLIDSDGYPRLLEVNSKPSQGIDVMGSNGVMERSPVDVAVKTKIMTDMLAFAATGERSALLRPVVVADDNSSRKPPPPTTELLDRVRRVFDVIVRKNAGPGGAMADNQAEPEMTSSKFTMFTRSAGLHTLLPGSDLMLAFTRECRRQPETKAVASRSYQIVETAQRTRTGHLPTPSREFRPREQVQTRMRFAAFARTLSQVADQAFASLHGPLPRGVSLRAARLEQLLNHMAGDTLPPKKPRTPGRGAQSPFACTESRLQQLELTMPPTEPLASMAPMAAVPHTTVFTPPKENVAPPCRPPSAPPTLDVEQLLRLLPQTALVDLRPRAPQRRRAASAHRNYAPGLYASLIQANQKIARQPRPPPRPSWVHPKPIYFP
jgi:hypothetical protein